MKPLRTRCSGEGASIGAYVELALLTKQKREHASAGLSTMSQQRENGDRFFGACCITATKGTSAAQITGDQGKHEAETALFRID